MPRLPNWIPHLLARLLGIAVVAVVTGLVVAWFDERAALLAWWTGPHRWTPNLGTPWDSVLFAALYTGCTWISVEGSIRLLQRGPLRHWGHVGGYVGVAAGIGFAVAYVLHTLTTWSMTAVGAAASQSVSFPTVALVTVTTSVLTTALFFAFRFYRDLRDAEAKRLEAERARSDAELRALRAQINPHFLFNTLNTIAALIRVRPSEAEGTTEDLADLFRYTLRASKHPTVPLADEWAATQRYLDIEQTRFRDRLRVSADLDPDVDDAQVPSLILQPLAENAVKHGVAVTNEPCCVRMCAQREGDTVTIAVHDTGPGFDTTDADAVLERGTGLANVRDRLQRTFGDAAALTLHPNGVVLRLPYRPAHNPDADASRSVARRSRG
jgi:signal transduction histidine kinase